MWQFSSATNCNDRACPMRIDGTLDDIDVNTVPLARAELEKNWKQGDLLPEKPPALQYLVSVRGDYGTSTPFWLGAHAIYSRPLAKSWETALN
jgi:hypothetical protein